MESVTHVLKLLSEAARLAYYLQKILQQLL